MTPARWKEIEAVFEQVRELPESERPAFFAKTCNGDEELRREVESLLASHAEAGDFIDKRSLFFAPEAFEETGGNTHTGDLIGPYRVLREIGRGGMGAVYLAERADEQYQKRVAIKLIKRGMDTDSVLRHFRNERQILASFDHPNIARLFDGGTTADGLPYFVMEYVEGVPIDKYCEDRQLSIVERLKLFRQVCGAVSYAHRHTVIHRDIKPSNILVTSDSESARERNGVPKLLDFGIAKILRPSEGAEALMTATGLRPMTPEYASPEQVCGEAVTTASDVYSLGIVLYELLTGSLPYRFTSHLLRDVERAITEQEPPKPSTTVTRRDGNSKFEIRKLKGDLDNIVLMALRKEPGRRYQSVEQFSEDIRRHLEALPVRARKDTLSYRAAKFVSRNRALTASAALVVVSLVGGLFATTWQAQRARAEKLRAERRFNDVRQLAHSVLFDYHDAIKNLPGATAVRERLVKDALIYLDSLTREASGDPALQRELAAAYERVGDVRGQAYGPSLGDMTGAMESYEKALAIRKVLVVARPKDVQNRRDLASSYAKVGRQLVETNQAARGTDDLRKALGILLQVNAERPAEPEIRYDLAAMYDALGLTLEDWWGDTSGALENHRKALALRRELVAADPENEAHRRNLSVTYVNIGRALAGNGDAKEALESNQKGLTIRVALFSANPNNADYRRLLAISYQNDGSYHEMLGDVAGALQSFRNKLALDEQAVAEDPVNVQSHEDLGYSCEKIGDLLATSGDHLDALAQYQKALAMYDKVSAVAPQILHLRYRRAFAHAGIARMQAKLGDQTAALVECTKTDTLLNDTPVDPNLGWQNTMRGHLYMQLGEAYATLAVSKNTMPAEQRQHWGAARDMYGRSAQIWEAMKQRGILLAEDAARPDEVALEIAKCDAALNKQ